MKPWQEWAIFLILFSGVILLYSIENTGVTWGSVDASTHFALSDYQSRENLVTEDVPPYISYIYGVNNNGDIWYPPQFHLLGAIIQRLTGSRIYSIYFYYTIISWLIVFTIFFFIKKIYGFWPGALSGISLILSHKDFMTFFWGLWPERAGFIFTPLYLYAYLKYTSSYLDGLEKSIYLYITALLCAIQFLFHPEGIFISFILIFVCTILLILTERRFPFSIKTAFLSSLIFILVVAPFIKYPLGFQRNINQDWLGDSFKFQEFSSLLHWAPNNIPYLPEMGVFSLMYPLPKILFSLIVLGLIYLIYNHRRQDMFLLGWFIGYYLLVHLNVVGLSSRIHRFLNMEAHILLPIAILGLFWLVKMALNLASISKKYAAIIIVLLLLYPMYVDIKGIIVSAPSRSDNKYLTACNWISENIPAEDRLLLFGVASYAQRKWIQALCQRESVYDDISAYSEDIDNRTFNYIFIDFQDMTNNSDIEAYFRLRFNSSIELLSFIEGVGVYRFG